MQRRDIGRLILGGRSAMQRPVVRDDGGAWGRIAGVSASRRPRLHEHMKLVSRSRRTGNVRWRAPRFCDNASGPAAANVKRITRVLPQPRYCSAQPVVGCRGSTTMTTRRLMYWWFRVVMSGRFLDRFLCLPRAH